MKVMVETSARHVHVSEADLKTLFGADAKLTVKKELSQPGQYASNEKVEVIIEKGVIAAKRHIHFNVEEAAAAGVEDKQIVSVKVGKEGERSVIFGDVVVRVSPKYAAAMHIDTDESNAAALGGTVEGEILK